MLLLCDSVYVCEELMRMYDFVFYITCVFVSVYTCIMLLLLFAIISINDSHASNLMDC